MKTKLNTDKYCYMILGCTINGVKTGGGDLVRADKSNVERLISDPVFARQNKLDIDIQYCDTDNDRWDALTITPTALSQWYLLNCNVGVLADRLEHIFPGVYEIEED